MKLLTFWIVVCSSIGGMLYGYDLGVFSGSIYLITRHIHLTTEDIGIAGGAVFIGGLAGTILTGYLSDKFGRRAMIMLGGALFIVGVILILKTNTFFELICSRVVLGIAVGFVSVAVPSYLSEIAPTPIRGQSVTIFQLFLTIGILFAFVIDMIFLPSGNWHLMYAILIIPAIILCITMFFLPESPRWLMSKGREYEALHILKITRTEEQALQDLATMNLAHLADQKSRWRDLFNRNVAPALTIVLLVAILNQLTAVNAVLLYAPAIFQAAGLINVQSAIEASTLIAFTNFIATVIGALLIDKLGRRFLLMFGTSGVCISYFFLGWAIHFDLSALYLLYGMLSFIFCFAVGPGYIVWLVLTELLPTGVRGKGLAVALFVNSLTSWLITSIFLEIKDTLGIGHTYFLFSFFTFLYFMVAWKLLPETSQRSLEQIQEDLAHLTLKHHQQEGK